MRLVFGPSEPLRSELQQAAQEHRGGRLQLAVAWVNEEGAGLLADATSGDLGALEAVVGINNQGTTVEGLLSLLASADSLRVLYQHPMMTFHPKAYCFDDGSSGRLLVGSSNMTAGGLDTNFEASIVLDLTPDLREQWGVFWSSLQAHPFSFLIDSHVDVEKLYKGGYISLEATTRARRRRLLRRTRRVLEGDSQNEFDLPTQGPIRRFRSTRARVEIPFDVVEEQLELPGLDDLDSESGKALNLTAPPPPALTRVFVRTLTANDVAKLHGARGTFEPDLGLAARDEDPSFWGWPDEFRRVVRELPRDERSQAVNLVSRITNPDGISVTLVIWFREERPGHPAEFRLSPRPIADIREAVPDDFDDTSLLVVERDSDGGFRLRLITARDPEYDTYESLLSVVKPAHRYGYGPGH